MQSQLLQLQNLTLTLTKKSSGSSFPVRSKLVSDISFSISRGECLSLVGESGSGKSLTSLSITGLLPPNIHITDGHIVFDGERLLPRQTPGYRDQSLRIRGSKIGMIFQEPMTALNPVFTIGEQVKETLLHYYRRHPNQTATPNRSTKNHNGLSSKKELYDQVLYWLRQVQIPDPERVSGQYAFELSGGLRQRAMIAIAICLNPQLLIADEPTTALDVTTQKEILNLLKTICRQRQMALLLITHDFGIVRHYAQRVCVLHQGRMVEQGKVKEILRSPKTDYSKGLLKAIPRIDKQYARNERLYTNTHFTSASQTLTASPSMSTSLTTEGRGVSAIVSVKNLKVHYPIYKGMMRQRIGAIKAIDDISFSVQRGSVFGIVGESGCGKSTLVRTLLRLEKITAGKIYYRNTNYTSLRNPHLRSIRKQMQIIFQDSFSALNPRMTVLEILSEPRLIHKSITKSNLGKEAKKWLDLVALDTKSLYRYPHEFSGGQRQRIAIARALTLQPEVLLADEAVSALDVSIQAQILNLLKDLREELGLTVLFVSHDLSVIKYMSEEMIVLYRGKIVESGSTDKVIANPKHHYTKKLLYSNLGHLETND